MKVKDLILYQVATDRDYKVGDVIDFSKQVPNGQYHRVFESEFKLGDKRLSDIVFEVAEKRGGKFKPKEVAFEVGNKLEYYDVIVKELAIEEVRASKHPSLPSRLHCMYLSMSKEIVLKNIHSMAQTNPIGKQFQAVAVKLNGTIFKAGKVYMSREGQSYNYYKAKAEKYWAQKGLKDEEVKEVLFEGKAEIIEILQEIRK